jgi:hypothetical protein
MTTLRAQNTAIALTTTAKSTGQAAGVSLTVLQTQLDLSFAVLIENRIANR